MSDEQRALVLRLWAPTQAWDSRRHAVADMKRRPLGDDHSDRWPTASGVVGLLGCALGRDRGQVDDLLELDVVVRVDQPGRARHEFRTSRRQKSGAVLVQPLVESVLDDAVFVVGVSGPASLIDTCATAVGAPRWAPYLGRREYPPIGPLVLDVRVGGAEAAVRATDWQARPWWRRRCAPHVSLPMIRRRPTPRHHHDDDMLTPVTVVNDDSRGLVGADWLSVLS